VEEKGSLGLYLAPDKAVAVWISSGTDAGILHKLSLKTNPDEPAGMALQAARAAVRQGFAFSEVFVAVDCSYFTQYNLTSEFDDYRQIESTIKFDVEEAAAADAVNMAVAFEITGKEAVGSAVTAYTADRQRLTDILLDIQEGGLDPTAIEPDAAALARALTQTSGFAEQTDSLFVILSESTCYMLRPHGEFAPMVRTFLVSGGAGTDAALAREILMARAAAEAQGPVSTIILMGQTQSVDISRLAERTGLKVKTEAPDKSLLHSLSSDDPMACHQLLIAYGAALAGRSRTGRVDFRRDFMPYQGQRKVLEGSLRVVSISVTVLLLAVGIFFQLKAFRMNRYAARLEQKNLTEHKAVMFGRTPPSGMQPSSNLKREYTRVKSIEEGIGLGDDNSIPAKLTYFLEAVNNTPANVDIAIQQITVTGRSMKVKGDTNSRAGTMSLLNEIKKHPRITLGSERIATDGVRDVFEITLEPKK
jgi:hypothetical protein